MAIFETVLLILHILVAVAICGFVLLQHGKGADMGAAFGSGSSGSVFGSAGSANFLSRSTAALATVFFLSSLALTWYGASKSAPRDVMQEGVMGKIPVQAPASDVPASPSGLAGGAPAVDPLKSLPAPAAPAAPVPSAPAGSKSGEVPK
ncbi:MAG: preprotein translocase subunit SecG [Betaproteobacteria bacterium]|nr:preprotein translocase subunit SecG [Betaproteobacteria bacterium]